MKFRQPDRAFPLAFALLIFLVGLTAFAPPGLCPCWLIAEVDKLHPHPDGHPERPHGHAYLFEMFQAGTVAILAIAILPADKFILHLSDSGLRWAWVTHPLPISDWKPPLLSPPPRPASPV